jgi:nickel transport protein
MRKSTLLFAAAFCALSLGTAQAHKLKAFATAVGADVSGYAYFVPGGRAQEAEVSVTLPDGKVVAQLHTNDRGEFSFTAGSAVDHMILIDAGDGHEASYTVKASEIGDAAPINPTVSTAAPASPALSPASTPADLTPLVEQAVARQLRPLREQIDAWQEKIWFHDVLGGLGYIIGIAGLFYGLTGTRRARDENARRRTEEARR